MEEVIALGEVVSLASRLEKYVRRGWLFYLVSLSSGTVGIDYGAVNLDIADVEELRILQSILAASSDVGLDIV